MKVISSLPPSCSRFLFLWTLRLQKSRLSANCRLWAETVNLCTWTELNWTELNWTELNWTELNWTELNWTELNWTELNWTELNWTELNWTELNWTELNWTELNWTELNWTELRRNNSVSSHFDALHRPFPPATSDVLSHRSLKREKRWEEDESCLLLVCWLTSFSVLGALVWSVCLIKHQTESWCVDYSGGWAQRREAVESSHVALKNFPNDPTNSETRSQSNTEQTYDS